MHFSLVSAEIMILAGSIPNSSARSQWANCFWWISSGDWSNWFFSRKETRLSPDRIVQCRKVTLFPRLLKVAFFGMPSKYAEIFVVPRLFTPSKAYRFFGNHSLLFDTLRIHVSYAKVAICLSENFPRERKRLQSSPVSEPGNSWDLRQDLCKGINYPTVITFYFAISIWTYWMRPTKSSKRNSFYGVSIG